MSANFWPELTALSGRGLYHTTHQNTTGALWGGEIAAHIAAVALARRLRPPYAPLASVSARAKRSACTYT